MSYRAYKLLGNQKEGYRIVRTYDDSVVYTFAPTDREYAKQTLENLHGIVSG